MGIANRRESKWTMIYWDVDEKDGKFKPYVRLVPVHSELENHGFPHGVSVGGIFFDDKETATKYADRIDAMMEDNYTSRISYERGFNEPYLDVDGKLVVDIEFVQYMKKMRRLINCNENPASDKDRWRDLRKIVWQKNGFPVEIPEDAIEDWKYTGLSNTDFPEVSYIERGDGTKQEIFGCVCEENQECEYCKVIDKEED